MKKLLKLLFNRIFLVGLPIVIQIFALVMFILRFSSYFVYFYAFCTLLSVVAVLRILSGKTNPAYKIAWIVPIMLFPIFGGLFYLMFGKNKLSKRAKRKMRVIQEKMTELLGQNEAVIKDIQTRDLSAANQSRYIENYSFCPVYQNTISEYLTPGERMYDRLLKELKKAERYIFLEYFIIEEGLMWNSILDILVEKASQGVDVRVIYDDVGCLFTLPYRYDKQLEKMGIKCCVFNPFIPILSARMNNRDHRKIAVIDGYTAFTGGINLADEYINSYVKHGHWKDSAIIIQGEAVWSFAVMFLSLWSQQKKTDEDYEQYRPVASPEKVFVSDGYVQPFGDSPLDDESLGETVYLNLISTAERYVYINSPYLILDNMMMTTLCSAAKRNVDVRIITPHITDKWYVHAVTRSNYDALVESGVKIYEYTPGFLHAKTLAVDDKLAVVGTINLDYRSLYLHFECGVWLYQTQSVLEVTADFLKTLEQCQSVTVEDCLAVKWYKRLSSSILRVFAPLM
ncbi:cardiolipin synthase [Desulfosporosinus lacus]|uniref:Cardiolipin synthase n=1 Tax=Desulfosporosinus lacus DSM 15449 TaxID=1121420 RepID=A0A1M5XP47_9FIRM|nr:cardiolipin synthase [Desulfosporosinus lacus]SHI01571.1 cardiolipin synthase [Desulfosporosinus lacus DSM 15449]